MSARERQDEIIRILRSCKTTTVPRLAWEFNKCKNTIYNDIDVLSREYAIVTKQGNGGGVTLMDSRHPHRNIFSREENRILCDILNNLPDYEANVIRRLVDTYGNKNFLEDES